MSDTYLSGFCSPTNPPEIHRGCPGAYRDKPCRCTHHQEATPVIDTARSAPTVGFHDDIPEAEYHADRGSLSMSGAKLILKAPALYRWRLDHPEHKDTFDYGSAAHAHVLGQPLDDIYVAPFKDWRTKQAQEEKKLAREAGMAAILPADWQQVCEMADKLAEHTLAMQLLSEGRAEVSAYAVDEETGVKMRGRMDWLGPIVLTDYKTCVSADPRDWAGRYGVVRKLGYDLQAEWYLNLARLCGHPAGAFAFIAQEKEPPYLVSVVYVDEADLDDAHQRRRDALRIFRDCTASGKWPGYLPDDTAARLSLIEQDYEEEQIA